MTDDLLILTEIMSSLNERLISWAQNEEMVNVGFTEHGIDCIAAAEVMEKQSTEIERLRGLLRETLTGETHGDWMMRVREALGE